MQFEELTRREGDERQRDVRDELRALDDVRRMRLVHDIAVTVVFIDELYPGSRCCSLVVKSETATFENCNHFVEREVSGQGPESLDKFTSFVQCN